MEIRLNGNFNTTIMIQCQFQLQKNQKQKEEDSKSLHMKRNKKVEIESRCSDLQQTDRYCPSIEQGLLKELRQQGIIKQNKLKILALQKAQILIKTIQQQNKQLLNQNIWYKNRIQQLNQQFQTMQQDYEFKLQSLQNQVNRYKQLLQERREDININILSNFSPQLDQKEQKFFTNKTVKKYKNELFLRDRNIQSPIKKMTLIQTISKQNNTLENASNNNLLQSAKLALLSKQVERILIDFQDMTDVLREQNKELQNYQSLFIDKQKFVKQFDKQLEKKNSGQNQFYREPIKGYSKSKSKEISRNLSNKKNYSIQLESKRIFSTEFSRRCPPEQNKVQVREIKQVSSQPIQSTLRQYEEIIQQYKQYSAYLKAYLCSCISFIEKQGQYFRKDLMLNFNESDSIFMNSKLSQQQNQNFSTDRSSSIINFPSNRIFSIILQNILSIVDEKISQEQYHRQQLQQQNKQLRLILDELVQNLKQIGVHQDNQNNFYQSNRVKQSKRSGKKYCRNENDNNINMRKQLDENRKRLFG